MSVDNAKQVGTFIEVEKLVELKENGNNYKENWKILKKILIILHIY